MVKWLLEQGIDLNVSEEELSLLGKFIQELPEKALGLGIRVLLAALALFIGLQSIRLLRRIVEKSLAKTNADRGVAQFLDSLIKIGLTTLLILMIAISFGLDAASVMAMLGSVGVAFALAMQLVQLCRRCTDSFTKALCHRRLYYRGEQGTGGHRG